MFHSLVAEKKAALQEDLKAGITTVSAATTTAATTATVATTTTTTTAAIMGMATAQLVGVATMSADMVACEQCGKHEHRTKLKRKRYCSPGCARLAKTSGGSNGSAVGMVAPDALALADKLDESLAAEEKMQTDALAAAAAAAAATAEPAIMMAELTAAMPMAAAAATPTAAAAAVTAIPVGGCNAAAAPNVAAVATAAVATAAAAPMPTPSSSSSANVVAERPSICSWSVDEVAEFIRKLPGCQDYVEDFVQQEIDGQALLLLKENHLVNAMGMKLGPALKIVAKVESMKEASLLPAAANDAAAKEAGAA